MKLSALVSVPFRAAAAPVNGLRRLSGMLFGRDNWRVFSLRRGQFDYVREVGDGTGSSTVAAPLLWMARTFPEAPPGLWKIEDLGQDTKVRDHPMLRLLERPNPYYTGVILWMATLTDWMVNGDGYWLKLPRTRAGTPAQLWYTPSWLMSPKGSSDAASSTLIDHYEYTIDGVPYRVNVEDVVHFRFGLDPMNPRRGQSPLKSVLREVFTDDEAARFTAALLYNMGIPGLVLSPDTDSPISDEDALATKDKLMEQFSGEHRGEPLVMTSRTKVATFGFSPEQLLLKELRRIPEERVTAVMGVPAIVAGLGAGLDRSTFTNMAEAREAAYESGVIPTQRILAEDVRWQLLNEYESDPFKWRFGFDLSKVRVLQEDLYRLAQRYDLAVRGGWAMVSEARRAVDLEVDEERDDVFLRQANVNVMRASLLKSGPASLNGGTPAPAPASGASSNGHTSPDEIADAVVRAIERENLRTGGARA